MTFQERWAEGPPVGPAEVREWLAKAGAISPNMQHLCQDYLTLRERNEEFEGPST